MTQQAKSLQNLLIYRNILKDDVIRTLLSLSSTDDIPACEFICELIKRVECLGLEGNALQNYIIYLVCHDENTFSRVAEKNKGHVGSSLCKAVRNDIATLKAFLIHTIPLLLENDLIASYSPTTSYAYSDFYKIKAAFLDEDRHYSVDEVLTLLKTYYIQHGYGDIADYAFFRWNEQHRLTGIKHYDAVTFSDIIGYDRQKRTLIENAQFFLADKPYHDVLLVGARGTGKSSSVKALVNEFYTHGLRLVEVPKSALADILTIMDTLRKYGKKFILFLDDLSFEENELEYKYLKSVLEGGVEVKPANVLICATSNRRHIIRESWHDRSGNTDDVHRFDSLHEKLSLSDRFGITLNFLTPSQEEYLHIVKEIAKKNNLQLDTARLQSEAIQWEMSHSGRSGRTARQLVTHLLASNSQ